MDIKEWKEILKRQYDKSMNTSILTEIQGEELKEDCEYHNLKINISNDGSGKVELKKDEQYDILIDDEEAEIWAAEYAVNKYGYDEIAKTVYQSWIPSFCDGMALYDFKEDEMIGYSLMGNEYISDNWDVAVITRIEATNDAILYEDNVLNDYEQEWYDEYKKEFINTGLEDFFNSDWLRNKYKSIDKLDEYRDYDSMMIELISYCLMEYGFE